MTKRIEIAPNNNNFNNTDNDTNRSCSYFNTNNETNNKYLAIL